MYFATIYAVPYLAYSQNIDGFGINSDKFEKIMRAKLEMQKRVYTEK